MINLRKTVKKISTKIYKIYIYISNCNNKRDKNLWVFTEWYGEKCGDNASYFANYVVKTCQEVQVVWISHKSVDISRLNPRIKVVEKDSIEAIRILKKAAVAVMIQGVNEFSEKGLNYLGNALKVNLWHGVMWKKLGYDISGKKDLFSKIVVIFRNHFKRNYLFEAPSDEYRKIFKSAFKIRENEFVNAGQPRNELFFNIQERENIKRKVFEYFQEKTDILINKETKIIAYMPTFRDQNQYIFSFREMESDEKFVEYLERNNLIIVQKVHFISNFRGEHIKEENIRKNTRIINDNTIMAQELMAAADILITDYSSCFFDYLLLDRPIIHFLYDYDYYKNEDRGLYYSWREVAGGDVIFKKEDLLYALTKNLENPGTQSSLRLKRRKKFLKYEAVNSSKIILENIKKRLITYGN